MWFPEVLRLVSRVVFRIDFVSANEIAWEGVQISVLLLLKKSVGKLGGRFDRVGLGSGQVRGS